MLKHNPFIISERFLVAAQQHSDGMTAKLPGLYTRHDLVKLLFSRANGKRIIVVEQDKVSEKWEMKYNNKPIYTFYLTNWEIDNYA